MAVWSVVATNELSPGLILAPERYHPHRELRAEQPATRLGELVQHVRETITPERAGRLSARYRVLDTSDVGEGLVSGNVPVKDGRALRSAKKLLRRGDVIISRLRPYLRQVAFVDDDLFGDAESEEREVACSTEFFVLRSSDQRSIAFLVPYLLTEAVQNVLGSAVEGGHHPRFAPDVLLGLPIPDALVADRNHASCSVTEAVRMTRVSERSMKAEMVRAGLAVAELSGAVG